jgi:3-carboxy-cis,cis-muconate cycloisomerase
MTDMTFSPFDNPLFADLLGDEDLGPLFTPEAEIAAMLEFEAALARAEAGLGFISAEAAEAIEKGCDNFEADIADLSAGIANDGVVVPVFVRELRKAVGDAHGKSAHFGTTSQDVIDSALVLRLSEAVDILSHRIRTNLDLIDGLLAAYGERETMGRTRMQRAIPITIADRLAAWRRPLATSLVALEDNVAPELMVVQLAGAAGNLDKFDGRGDEVRAALASELGLADPGAAWHSDRTRIVDFSDWLSKLSGTCGKIGMDLVLLAQNEVSEIRLATGGGSSAMPHKRNPVLPETLVTLARYNSTQSAAMQSAMVHEFERSGMAWTLEWLVLPQMIVTAGRSLDLLSRCLDGLEFTGEG